MDKIFSCFMEDEVRPQICASDIRVADEITEHQMAMFVEGDVSAVKIKSSVAMKVVSATNLEPKVGDKYNVAIGKFLVEDLEYLEVLDLNQIGDESDIFLKFVPIESPTEAIVYAYADLTCIVSVNGKEV